MVRLDAFLLAPHRLDNQQPAGLKHAPGFTAVCNPTVNSYKRLMPAWDAPVLP